MGSGRYVPMTDEEIWEFLAGQTVMRLATVDTHGDPHVVPMWYAVIGRRLGMRSAADARKKVGNLLRTGRFAAVIDTGGAYQQLRGVMLKGRAYEADATTAQQIVDGFAERYYAGTKDLTKLPEPVQEKLADLPFTYVVLEPEKIVSWDNRKWVTDDVEGAGD